MASLFSSTIVFKLSRAAFKLAVALVVGRLSELSSGSSTTFLETCAIFVRLARYAFICAIDCSSFSSGSVAGNLSSPSVAPILPAITSFGVLIG